MEGQPKRRQTSTGKCNLCGRTFGKAAMTRHLQTCYQQQEVPPPPSPTSRFQEGWLFHIVVTGRYLPEYWLHLDVPAAAKLSHLDSFLRRIWLECCGHMSGFEINGERFYSSGARELEGRSMNYELDRLLQPGLTFYYEYDFGTTTDLTLKVAARRKGLTDGKSIRVLARNAAPAIACQSCGKPATQVCTQCIWDGDGWLCDECTADHECGEDMFLPVVNSPRVGMCGYTGD